MALSIQIAGEQDLPAVFALRTEVFVVEQRVAPELEMDGEDDHALHVVAKEDGAVLGCARVLLEAGAAHIGRLAVKRERRGQGIGRAICRYVMEDCRDRGCGRIWLHAQLHAVAFYEALGFQPQGEIFLEAGIEHRTMEIFL